jgi:drug/metabolite transporter (DMT)-like permease
MSHRAKLLLALLLVYLLWGSTFMGVKIATATLPPLLISGLRFLVGGAILWAFMLARERALPRANEMRNAAFLGLLLSGAGTASVAYAIDYIPTGIVSLFSATVPLWIFALNYLFFSRERPTLAAGLGLGLGIVGIAYLLDPAGHADRPLPWFPVLVVGLGCVSWSYGSLKSKQLALPKSSFQSVAIQMVSGGLVSLLASLLAERGQWQAIVASPAKTWLALAYLIFIGSYLGYSAYNWLINNASPQIASTYAYVNPVVAIFLGWLFLGEQITTRILAASLITLSGVVLMTLGKAKFWSAWLKW